MFKLRWGTCIIRYMFFSAGFGSSSLPIGIPPCSIPRGSVGSLSQSPPSPYGSYPHSILSMHTQKDSHTDVSMFILTTSKHKWATARQNQQNGMLRPVKTWISLRILKTRISVRICTVWSVSSLLLNRYVRTQGFFMWTVKTDQTGRKPRLIEVFTGRTGHFVGFVLLRAKYGFTKHFIKHLCASSFDKGTYHIGEQQRHRQACAVSPEPP